VNRGRQIAWARSISEAGDMFRILAFPLAVMGVRGNPVDLAWSETLGTLGMFTGSLLAPLVVDRVPRLKALVVSDFLSLCVTALLAVGVVSLSLPLLFLAYFLSRAIDSFHYAALDAATADLLTEERRPLVAGFSHLQLFLVGGSVAGGLAAAQVVPYIPLWSLLLVDGISFLVASTWIYRLAGGERKPVKPWSGLLPELKGAVREWKEGFRASTADREVRKHLAAQALLGLAYGVSSSTVRGHLIGTMNVSPREFGYLAPFVRASFLAGAFANLKLASFLSPAKLAFLGISLMAAGYLGMAWLALYPLFLLAYGLQQVGNAFVVPVNRAAVMGGVDAELRGRAAAFRGLLIDGATVIGNLLAVWLISYGTGVALRVLAPLALAAAAIYTLIRRWP
jgi:MFS family permease